MIEYDDRDQIPTFLLRSSHSGRKFIEGRLPLASVDSGPEFGRAISLDDIGGIESRARQSPAILRYAILRTSRVHRAARRCREDWRQAHHARGTERKTSDPHFSQR